MSVRRLSILAPGLMTLLVLVGCGDDHPGQADASSRNDGMTGDGPDGAGEGGDLARADAPAEVAADGPGEARGDGAAGDVGPTCSDGLRNGDETDVDCGGGCGRCAIGRACRDGADCASGACNAGHICIECLTAANCPGQDTECGSRACVGGACVVGFVAAGTVLVAQTPGDCRSRRCDGAGQISLVADDADLPDDGNPCSREVCTGGVPSNPPAPAATACGSGRLCDGAGHCVGCLTPGDCPGNDDDCKTRSCEQNLCGFTFRASGIRVATQVAGDCKADRCDGAGHVVPGSDDTDLPVDGNSCTDDVCTSGVASNPNRPLGTACVGGNHCDSAGRCVACLIAADCPGADSACRKRTCVQGACGFDTLANGTPVVAQTPGDCKVIHCDGTGAAITDPDNADLPVDGNACTSDVCTAGVPSNPPLPQTTGCGGSNLCDGAGHCVGCLSAADCPGEDSACQTRTCDGNMVCGLNNVPDGVPAGAQIAGNCVTSVCNGAGVLRPQIEDSDVRIDGNPCTRDVCSQGTPSNPFSDPETVCPGGVCDGQGNCVACVSNADCGSNGPCATFTCSAGHTCSHVFVGAGTAIATQTGGDCKVVQCDGNGGQTPVTDPGDVADDGNSCTDDVCQGQTPAHPPRAAGTGCGGTSICDGAGNCGPAPSDAGAGSDADAAGGGGDDAGADAASGGCPAPFVFCDDFEDGNASGDASVNANRWTAVEQTTGTPGAWRVMSETAHGGAPSIDLQGTGGSTSYHYDFPAVSAAGGPWGDQTVSVWVKPTATALTSDNNKPGVCARFTTLGSNGTTSAYCLFIRAETGATNGRLQISKKTTTVAMTGLVSTTTSGFPPATIPLFALDTWYKLALQVSGSGPVVLTAYVNDVKLVTFTDVGAATDGGVEALTSGGPALIVRGTTASFDDLRVSVP